MMLDGYSRFVLDWELMPDMLGSSVEMFVQRVKEKYPYAKPRLINDNGSQFISLDFKRLLEKLEIQQVFTRRNHPQTNGKIERLNGTVKNEAIRPNAPSTYQEAWNILNNYSYQYNYQRLEILKSLCWVSIGIIQIVFFYPIITKGYIPPEHFSNPLLKFVKISSQFNLLSALCDSF